MRARSPSAELAGKRARQSDARARSAAKNAFRPKYNDDNDDDNG